MTYEEKSGSLIRKDWSIVY